MINIKHLQKVVIAWTSIVWTICFVGVVLFTNIRTTFMQYGLHTTMNFGENVMTLTTFVSGLVIWNIIAFFSVGLFAILFNKIKA